MAPRGGALIATSTYVGDGAATQAIVGVGFRPKYVRILTDIVYSATARQAWKITQDGLNALFWHPAWGNRYLADHLISLDADGFTVGDGTGANNYFNNLGVTYHYLCFG